jgi:hypothetical protein
VAGSFSGTGLRYGRGGQVGTRAVHIPLTRSRLTVVQRTPGFVLVREHGTGPVDAPGLLQSERADDGPAVLVRPDGYVAWTGSSSDQDGWRACLSWWSAPASVASRN